jgi:uncharacterized protein (TIGR03437 family)
MFRFLVLAIVVSASTATAQVANNVVSAGYSQSFVTMVAPGQVISLFVKGLNVPNAAASTDPWPTTLGGVRVVVAPNPNNLAYPTALPILSVSSDPLACAGDLTGFCKTTNIVVQFPYEPICAPNWVPATCNSTAVYLAVQVNGVAGQGSWFSTVAGPQPHVLNSCDSISASHGESCNPAITHADGSLVGGTMLPGISPAHPGEEIVIYAVGLGATANAKTGQIVTVPDPLLQGVYFTPAIFTGTTLQFGAPIKADWAGLVPGFVGLYQMNVRLPPTVPGNIGACGSPAAGIVRLFFGNFGDPAGLDTPNTAPFIDVCVANTSN